MLAVLHTDDGPWIPFEKFENFPVTIRKIWRNQMGFDLPTPGGS
jgi:hypothetical protein